MRRWAFIAGFGGAAAGGASATAAVDAGDRIRDSAGAGLVTTLSRPGGT
jgi:hypothetical protein